MDDLARRLGMLKHNLTGMITEYQEQHDEEEVRIDESVEKRGGVADKSTAKVEEGELGTGGHHPLVLRSVV